jgi:heme oxygenase
MHRAAENSGVMARILAGDATRASYVALIANLQAIYRSLERALARHAAHPAVSPIRLPGLERAAALRRDLDALAGQDGEAPLVPATADYVARIDELDARWPAGLVAHAYVRYLGDLSGGRVLRDIVRRALGLSGTDGLAFYDFGPGFDAVAARTAYRGALDALPLAAGEADLVVDEAVDAFRRHIRMFDELARAGP